MSYLSSVWEQALCISSSLSSLFASLELNGGNDDHHPYRRHEQGASAPDFIQDDVVFAVFEASSLDKSKVGKDKKLMGRKKAGSGGGGAGEARGVFGGGWLQKTKVS